MDRVAVYRRALTPTALWAGFVGVAGALIGVGFGPDSGVGFVWHWLVCGVVASIGALASVRREALRQKEPFCTPPSRRVARSVAPCVCAAAAGTLIYALAGAPGADGPWIFAAVWTIAYGCAAHAAGFFMPRGVTLMGWIFVGFGVAAFGAGWMSEFARARPVDFAHGVMGAGFGVLHLGYAVYLILTAGRHDS